MTRLPFLIVVCLTATTATAATAQNATDHSPASLPDTSVWRPIIERIFESVTPFIARTATDTSIQVWLMRFPDSKPPWARLEKRLRAALRSRPPTAADSSYYELEVGPLVVTGDTARVKLRIGMTSLCPGSEHRGGYGNEEEIVTVKFKSAMLSFWSAARPRSILHGDSFGCR